MTTRCTVGDAEPLRY